MNLFHVLDEASVILRDKRGVYRQSKLFRRGDGLYAGLGTGFIRLHTAGGTSTPTVRWDDLSVEATHDPLGRLLAPVQDGA